MDNVYHSYLSAKIIPVFSPTSVKQTLHIGHLAMQTFGSIEVVLRNSFALPAISLLKENFPELKIGAATILTADQADKAIDYGSDVLLSPGLQDSLVKHIQEKKYPYIPGVATPSDIEKALAWGYSRLKVFPISILGEVTWLKAMYSVYSHKNISFVPLGGITKENITDYLNLAYVDACGGSWLCKGTELEIKQSFLEAFEIAKKYK